MLTGMSSRLLQVYSGTRGGLSKRGPSTASTFIMTLRVQSQMFRFQKPLLPYLLLLMICQQSLPFNCLTCTALISTS